MEWLAAMYSHILNRGSQIVSELLRILQHVRDYSSSGNHHFDSDLKSADL